MLTNDQSYEENKQEFVSRLIEAGWWKDEAEKEWQEIQDDPLHD